LNIPAVLPEQESVEVVELPAGILVVPSVQVNPLGDETPRVTVPLKLLKNDTLIVLVPVLVATRITEFGFGVIEKSGTGIVRTSWRPEVIEALVPFTANT
jgi:hypothetical protein